MSDDNDTISSFNLNETHAATNIESTAESPIIRHSLFEDEVEEEQILQTKSILFEGYVESSDIIKDHDVDYEEIDVQSSADFQEVNIKEKDVEDFVVIDSKANSEIEEGSTEAKLESESSEDQILMFDLEVNNVNKIPLKENDTSSIISNKMETATSHVEEIKVNEHIEVAPITEVTKEKTITYSLDNYQEMEDHLNEAKPKEFEDELSDEEITFETRIVDVPEKVEETKNEPEDPLNMPISKLLTERTEIRKRQMKEFNYKFNKKPSHIDEIEKQPAYKRMGIELEEMPNQETNISRTSLNIDEDNDIDLRTNNSFLHDNVD
jgi:cell division protein FtsZ